MTMKKFDVVLLIGPFLAVGCASDFGRTRGDVSRNSVSLVEKYEDCMSDMRGDVFAERTCQVYLESAGNND